MKKKIKYFTFWFLFLPEIKNEISFQITKAFFKPKHNKTFNWRLGKINFVEKGEGTPLLLIHSLKTGASHKEWEQVIDSLSKKYRVFAIDLLGYGLSDKPKTTYSAYTFAKLIADFIEYINEPVTLAVSEDMATSGVIACQIKKEKISKLILIDPLDLWEAAPDNKNNILRLILETPVLGTLFYSISASCITIVLRFIKETGHFPKFSEFADKFFNSYTTRAGERYSFASKKSSFNTFSAINMLPDIISPVIIWSEGKRAIAEDIKKVNKTARVFTIKNIDSYPMIKKPADFCRIFIDMI